MYLFLEIILEFGIWIGRPTNETYAPIGSINDLRFGLRWVFALDVDRVASRLESCE